MEEISAEEIIQNAQNAPQDAPQDDGEDLIKINETEA